MFTLRTFLRTLPALALVVFQVILAPAAIAAPGDLDPTFGVGGKVTTDFALNGSSDDDADGVAIQSDGRIVVVGVTGYALPNPPGGHGSSFALVRYRSNGDLDPTFGIGGKVNTEVGGAQSTARAVALQPDGRIVVAGTSVVATNDFALARYNQDGSLDTTFSTDGQVTTDFSGGPDAAQAVALQPDGKIVVAGSASIPGVGLKWALARYATDGSLDTAFGTGGKVAIDFPAVPTGGGLATSLAIQPDGKIVAAGNEAFSGIQFALIRFNNDGSLDPSFGVGGGVHTDFPGSEDGALGVALKPNGKIVAVGFTVSAQVTEDFAVAIYAPDGSLDPSFGVGGKVTTDFARAFDEADTVALGPNGTIIVGGCATIASEVDFALARYLANGQLDGSFGVGGLVATDAGENITDIAVQPNSNIVAVGSHLGSVDEDFAVARFQGTEPVVLTPTISTFVPRTGPVGTPVTISGTNFTGATWVTFNGLAQPSFSVDVTGTVIRTTVPPGASSGPIWVVSPNGWATSGGSFVVTTGRYVRGLTLNMWGHLVAAGTLSATDTFPACIQDVAVRIQRHGRWGWNTVAKRWTDAYGWYHANLLDRTGRYRARVPEMMLPSGDVCLLVISPVTWHHV